MEKPYISAKSDSKDIIELMKIIAQPDEVLFFAGSWPYGSTPLKLNEYKKELQITEDQDSYLSKIRYAFIATNMRIIAIKKENKTVTIYPINYSNISDPKYKISWLGIDLKFYVNETKQYASIISMYLPSTEFKEFYEEIFLPALNIIKTSEKDTDQNTSNSIIFKSHHKNIETCPTCNHKLNSKATKCINCGNYIPEIYLGGLQCYDCDLFFTNKKIYVKTPFSKRHETGVAVLGGVMGSFLARTIERTIDEVKKEAHKEEIGGYHEEMFKKCHGIFDKIFLLSDIKNIKLREFEKIHYYNGATSKITFFDNENKELFDCYSFDNTRNIFSEIYPNFII
jgi:hypothetical protein